MAPDARSREPSAQVSSAVAWDGVPACMSEETTMPRRVQASMSMCGPDSCRIFRGVDLNPLPLLDALLSERHVTGRRSARHQLRATALARAEITPTGGCWRLVLGPVGRAFVPATTCPSP